MDVLASPAQCKYESISNPYIERLYEAVAAHDVRVHAYKDYKRAGNRQRSTSSPDIFHIHWPDSVLNLRNPKRIWKQWRALIAQLDALRKKGTAVVWTVHNLSAHDGRFEYLEKWFWRSFTRRLDGYISLSDVGRDLARQKFPKLRRIPGFVIRHGHYRGDYPDHVSREEARRQLGIDADIPVLLFFGRIRSYKNVPQLIRSFQGLETRAQLVIAGKPNTPSLDEDIEAAMADDPRVMYVPSLIPDSEVQLYFRAADVVVLPFAEILNSGSAMLALSFDVPVIVPRMGSLIELEKIVGNDWIYSYEGEIDSEVLSKGLDFLMSTHGNGSRPNLDAFEWDVLGAQTVEAYAAISRPTGTAQPRLEDLRMDTDLLKVVSERRLYGVLVTYRRPDKLAAMLDGVASQEERLSRLVVVDNYPTDRDPGDRRLEKRCGFCH